MATATGTAHPPPLLRRMQVGVGVGGGGAGGDLPLAPCFAAVKSSSVQLPPAPKQARLLHELPLELPLVYWYSPFMFHLPYATFAGPPAARAAFLC